MSVYKKLQDARVELQRMPLQKSGNNKFAGYSYFELSDFMPAVQEIFQKQGLCGVLSYGKEMAALVIHDIDSKDAITFTSPMSSASLKGCHEVQNLGAVESYIRRYLWTTALEIVENDVLDATTGKDEPVKKKAEPAPAVQPAPVITTQAIPAPVGVATQPAIIAPVGVATQPAVAQNLSTPVPAGTPVPNKLAGKPESWQLVVTADPNAGKDVWIDAVNEALLTTLAFADTEEDLKNIFKVNKVIFDTYKSFDEGLYKELTDAFAARKAKINSGA